MDYADMVDRVHPTGCGGSGGIGYHTVWPDKGWAMATYAFNRRVNKKQTRVVTVAGQVL